MIALFHDAPEIITGDMPTPVKYFDSEIRNSYQRIEDDAVKRLLDRLPDDLRDEYARCLVPDPEEEGELIALVKAADKLSALSPALLREAESYFSLLSVVPEGKVALENGVHAMHDVTEGGILGAAWEICYAGGLGLVLDKDAIPVTEATQKIVKAAGIDPLRLLGSGSLLIGCPDGEAMVRALRQAGIHAAVIGKVAEEGFRSTDGAVIDPPREDALYDAFAGQD